MSDLSSDRKCIPFNKQVISNQFVLVQTQDCFSLRQSKQILEVIVNSFTMRSTAVREMYFMSQTLRTEDNTLIATN